jgi:hypothetical protein
MDEINYWFYQDDPGLRAVELGRPGSAVAPYLSTYSFGSLQRFFRWLLQLLPGLHDLSTEISVRSFSVASFVLLVLLTWFVSFRRRRSEFEAALAALVVASTPLLLHYATEGRPYSLSALLGATYLVSTGRALSRGGWWTLLTAGLGFALLRSNWWTVCIPVALTLWGAWEAWRTRSLSMRQVRLLGVIAPAGLLAAAEMAFIMTTPSTIEAPFPLFFPQGFRAAIVSTAARAFSPFRGLDPGFVPQAIVVAASILLVVLAVLASRKRPEGEVPIALVGLGALVLSALLGGLAGRIVYGRHQVAMVGALVFGAALATGRAANVMKAALVSLAVVFLPGTIDTMNDKGNGKALALILESKSPAGKRPALVVQHSTRLGYPDPLNTVGADFYLNAEKPQRPPFAVYELPSHTLVTNQRGVIRYFNGGPGLLRRFADSPMDEWVAWLKASSHDTLWFLWLEPASRLERDQAAEYRDALGEAGFRPVPKSTFVLRGYPPSLLQRFDRVDVK